MNVQILLAVLGVLIVWGVVSLGIRRWGPGRAKRSVLCPVRKLRADVIVEQREGDFGCLRVTDAVACSLFPNGRLDCVKECLWVRF